MIIIHFKFFGFVLSIIYAILVGLGIIKIVRGGVNSTPSYGP